MNYRQALLSPIVIDQEIVNLHVPGIQRNIGRRQTSLGFHILIGTGVNECFPYANEPTDLRFILTSYCPDFHQRSESSIISQIDVGTDFYK